MILFNLEIDLGNSYCKWRLVAAGEVVKRGISQTQRQLNAEMFESVAELAVVKVKVCSVVRDAR